MNTHRLLPAWTICLAALIYAPIAAAQIVLNPNTIEGDVQVGSETITRLTMRANSVSDGLNATQTSSLNTNIAPYDLTVQVEAGTFRDYYVSANINIGATTINLNNRLVRVTDGTAAEQDFIIASPGVVEGTVTVTGGGEIASLTIRAAQSVIPFDNYSSRVNAGTNPSIADFQIPAVTGQEVYCSGTVFLTSGDRINLPSELVTVPATGSVRCDYTVETPPMPEFGNIAGSLDFTGAEVVDRYHVRVSGTGSGYSNLNRVDFDGTENSTSYVISDLPVGTNYRFTSATAYLNSNDDTVGFVGGVFDPSNTGLTVSAAAETTVNISACQAAIEGSFDFTGTANLADLISGTVSATSSDPTGNGFSVDRLVAGDGTYDLIVTEGNWATHAASFSIFRDATDPRGYLNQNISVGIDPYPYDYATIGCGGVVQQDYTLETGSTTITFDVGGGQTLSAPRIHGNCMHDDPTTNEPVYTYGFNSQGDNQIDVTQASVSLEAPQGVCNVTARATVNGSTLTFGTIENVVIQPGSDVIIDVGGPTMSVVSPTPNEIVDASSITVTGTATDDVEVDTVTVNGVSATLTPSGNPSDPNEVDFTADVTLAKGPNTLTIIATDTSAKTGQVTQTVYNDAAPPSLTFTPAGGSTTYDEIVEIDGNAMDDAGVESVVISVNGTEIANLDAGGVLDFDFMGEDAALNPGVNTINVVATDISEREISVSHSVQRLLNSTPIAEDDAVTMDEDTTVTIDVSANDSDPDGNLDPSTVMATGGPANGTLTNNGNGSFDFTPISNFYDSDAFGYEICDSLGACDSAAVIITINPVNDAPTVADVAANSAEDSSSDITLDGMDIDGDPLTYMIVGNPSNGSVEIVDEVAAYTPAPNFNGSDSFTYMANDGTEDSNVATVMLTVQPENDAPTANSQSLSTAEDTPVDITLTGDDVDNDTLTFDVSGPSDGTLSGVAPYLTYTPNLNFNGPDEFTFMVSDGQETSSPATVSINVLNENDAPTAADIAVDVVEDMQTDIALDGMDPDDDSLSYTILDDALYGTIVLTGDNASYTPDANFDGTDSFTYKANDGLADSNVATVLITILPVNDPPVANPASVMTDEDVPVAITLTGSDPDGDIITFALVAGSGPDNGTLSGTPPNLTYTPDAGFFGTDSFDFITNDGGQDSDPATVSITVAEDTFEVFCGDPGPNSFTDRGTFLWYGCGGDELWHLRVTGGSSPSRIDYVGRIQVPGGVTSFTPVELEANDTLDDVNDPNALAYHLIIYNTGIDGIDFTVPAGACIHFDAPGLPRYLGATRVMATDDSVSLDTGAACGASIAVDDVQASEADPEAVFTVRLSEASGDTVTVDYTTEDDTAMAPSDYMAASGTVEFLPGELTKPVPITLNEDTDQEGTERFNLRLSNPMNALLVDDLGIASILDNDGLPCGAAPVDPATDRGAYLSKDCSTGDYRMLVTAGGQWGRYIGTVSSDQGFTSVLPDGLEANDGFIVTADEISFDLRVGQVYTDAFTFGFPVGSEVCVGLDRPVDMLVRVGPSATEVMTPFSLPSLGPCAPGLSISDASGEEGETVDVTVSLSAPSASVVTVEYTTEDDTAMEPGDYTAGSGVLTFNPGTTSQTVTLTLIDDGDQEPNETFNVRLSNATGAGISDDLGVVTIQDNDGMPCGAASIDVTTDRGAFVSRDCGSGEYTALFTAAGQYARYIGTVVSDLGFISTTPVGLEPSDVLTVGPNQISYDLRIGQVYTDAFRFEVPTGANVCIDMTTPAATPMYTGPSATPVPPPFTLPGLMPCP